MRITPACAGNKINYSWIKYRSQDHPRVCEEQFIYAREVVGDQGSPPRVRGTGLSPSGIRLAARITPACAGNSWFVRLCSAGVGDHPRVCGEQASCPSGSLWLKGSPPRVRGTAQARGSWHIHGRITPACAGNSPADGAEGGNQQDHPRVCGEQVPWASGKYGPQGSPPRVRGTAHGRNEGQATTGITPACAGNRPACPARRFQP